MMAPAFDAETDVVVVGSGAAGLTAALAASAAGAEVVVLEKAPLVGGTTAVSAGAVWIPGHPHLDDDPPASDYLRHLAGAPLDDELLDSFLRAGPEMVRFVERVTSLELRPLAALPDYLPHLPGASPGGRSLDPGLYDTRRLGAWRERLRLSPVLAGAVLSLAETLACRPWSQPAALPFALLAERAGSGIVHYGAALVGHLLEALLGRGIEPLLATPARHLLGEEGAVTGVGAERGGAPWRLAARRGVVLASGGFEWSAELVGRFLGGAPPRPLSPPGNDGDGLRMAMTLGAELADLDQAWWCPAVALPGERYDERPMWRGDFTQRALPHSLVVNRHGRRFTNEAANYHDFTRALRRPEEGSRRPANLPAWLVLERRYLERYPLFSHLPGMPEPLWLVRAESLRELAGRLGVDPAALEATVERFSELARLGIDTDFGRGDNAFDRLYGDAEHRPHPNLGPLAEPPFYAVELQPGTLGTKGGVAVDGAGRVRRAAGGTIPGLFAAGNVMAGFTGPSYPGGGSTIGLAMTFGYLAGSAAARRTPAAARHTRPATAAPGAAR